MKKLLGSLLVVTSMMFASVGLAQAAVYVGAQGSTTGNNYGLVAGVYNVVSVAGVGFGAEATHNFHGSLGTPYTLAVTARLPVGKFAINGRVGAVNHEGEYLYGVGGEYDIASNFGLRVDYNRYQVKNGGGVHTNQITGAVVLRF